MDYDERIKTLEEELQSTKQELPINQITSYTISHFIRRPFGIGVF